MHAFRPTSGRLRGKNIAQDQGIDAASSASGRHRRRDLGDRWHEQRIVKHHPRIEARNQALALTTQVSRELKLGRTPFHRALSRLRFEGLVSVTPPAFRPPPSVIPVGYGSNKLPLDARGYLRDSD